MPKKILNPATEASAYNWFPGHMKKTLDEMRKVLKQIDTVIEVRDARAPNACINPAFEKTFAGKKRIVLLHKAFLADLRITKEWQRELLASCDDVLISDKKDPKIYGKIVRSLKNIHQERNRKFLDKGMRVPPICVLIAGLPNTGKSTLINLLLKKKRATIGDKPGVTRNLSWVAPEKDLLLLDSPGVFLTKPDSKTSALKLAAIHCLRDERIDFCELAEFVFEFLRTHKPAQFRRLFPEIDTFKNSDELWSFVPQKYLKILRDGKADQVQTCRAFIKGFRDGEFGSISLEWPEQKS